METHKRHAHGSARGSNVPCPPSPAKSPKRQRNPPECVRNQHLNALDGNSPLPLQSLAVPLLLLHLAVFQLTASVALQHTVLATIVTAAETAVTNDSLGRFLAFLELTSDLLWCSALERQSEMQSALTSDAVIRQCA